MLTTVRFDKVEKNDKDTRRFEKLREDQRRCKKMQESWRRCENIWGILCGFEEIRGGLRRFDEMQRRCNKGQENARRCIRLKKNARIIRGDSRRFKRFNKFSESCGKVQNCRDHTLAADGVWCVRSSRLLLLNSASSHLVIIDCDTKHFIHYHTLNIHDTLPDIHPMHVLVWGGLRNLKFLVLVTLFFAHITHQWRLIMFCGGVYNSFIQFCVFIQNCQSFRSEADWTRTLNSPCGDMHVWSECRFIDRFAKVDETCSCKYVQTCDREKKHAHQNYNIGKRAELWANSLFSCSDELLKLASPSIVSVKKDYPGVYECSRWWAARTYSDIFRCSIRWHTRVFS